MVYSFQILTEDKAPKVQLQRFYKKNGYKGRIQLGDICAWLEVDRSIIAAVRLSPSLSADGDYLLLKGLWVARNSIRQGFGSKLLREVSKYLMNQEKACYCLAYSHLETFYNAQAFEEIPQKETPLCLWQRFQRYQNRGADLLLMQFHPKKDAS